MAERRVEENRTDVHQFDYDREGQRRVDGEERPRPSRTHLDGPDADEFKVSRRVRVTVDR